jgi:hypothetical protein
MVIVAWGAELVRSGGAAEAEQLFFLTLNVTSLIIRRIWLKTRRGLRGKAHGPLSPEGQSLLTYKSYRPDLWVTLKRLQRKRLQVADTTKIEDKLERKKLKRIARKKAAPKAKRTGARGENKKKLKKAARGVSKR